MKLNNKTILLTGASGGIGQAMATALARKGAKLLLAGRDRSKLTSQSEALIDTLALTENQRPTVICADLGTTSGRDQIVREAHKANIDILINNAGYQDFALFADQSPVAVEQTLQTNLVSPILLVHALLPDMLSREKGTIVNVGSTFGSIGHPAFVAYCASKFGLRGFTEALRRELSDTPLTIHYLAPRATRTTLNSDAVTAMNNALGNASDDAGFVANALLALLNRSEGSNYFVGWPEKLFARINGVIPAVVDKALRKQLPIIRQFARNDH